MMTTEGDDDDEEEDGKKNLPFVLVAHWSPMMYIVERKGSEESTCIVNTLHVKES